MQSTKDKIIHKLRKDNQLNNYVSQLKCQFKDHKLMRQLKMNSTRPFNSHKIINLKEQVNFNQKLNKLMIKYLR